MKPMSAFPEQLSSSTIFGAICSAVAELLGQDEVKTLLPGETLPLLISSAFPFVREDGKKIRFFPFPILPSRQSRQGPKKEINFVQEDIFREMISSGLSKDAIFAAAEDGIVQGGLLCSRRLDFGIFLDEAPHNLLNRLTCRSEEIFYRRVAYFKNSGLFFLLKCDASTKSKVECALRYLEDSGIGGDISGGFGHFRFELEEFPDFGERKDAERFLTLSLYLPARDELDIIKKGSPMYRLVRRGGRCRDGVMKKSVIMFDHGSTFPLIRKEYIGRVETVRKNPPVVEWGIAYPVRFREVQT
ncbi:MAG: hypothetical protein APU95_02975 [Hadesarchaea archaeon YNP_N21]|nr:MAG: hypothetical protein APU95_02975 [Hadesarchaea archaeon YNP_N21]